MQCTPNLPFQPSRSCIAVVTSIAAGLALGQAGRERGYVMPGLRVIGPNNPTRRVSHIILHQRAAMQISHLM